MADPDENIEGMPLQSRLVPVKNVTIEDRNTEDLSTRDTLHQNGVDGNTEEMPLRSRPMPDKKPTFKQQFASCMNNITVEPVTFLMLLSSILAAVTTQNLALEKACRVNLNLGDAICNALKNQDANASNVYEKEVQQYVAFYINWKSVITSVLPGLILAFVGGWMDMTGRRTLLMMLPVIGEILQNLSNILNVVFFYQLSVEYLIFFDAFFGSFAGGWSVMFLAVFCYIADITTEVNRTHRLGLVSFCTYVGMPIGLALSGVILKNFGYYAIYGTSMSLHILNLLYIIFILHDPVRTKDQKLEEVLIAESGANNSNLEQKMKVYGIVIASLITVIASYYLHLQKVKTWARREIVSVMSMS